MKNPLAIAVLAGLAAVTTFGGCEDKSPAPMAGKQSQGDPAAGARQTRDAVKNVEGNINEAQRQAADAADSITGGDKKPMNVGGGGAADGTFPVGGVQFKVPEGWKPLPLSNAMRMADLQYTGTGGTANAVFYTSGGTTEANIDRWKKQMGGGDGKVTTTMVNGLKATRLEMTGSYDPGAMMGGAPISNAMFVGVIVEGGDKPIQIKLVGPEPTVKSALPSFDAMINAMRRP